MKSREQGVTGIKQYLDKIPPGSSTGLYHGAKYQITKDAFNNGKSLKLFARELGGNDFISLNYYLLKSGDRLCPCEMPSEKVISFLHQVKITAK